MFFKRSARQGDPSSPTGVFNLGEIAGFVGRLEEPPGVGLLYSFLTGGDPELAVDGLDLISYRIGGDVETLRHLPGGEVAVEEPKNYQFALG
jgi:hypothetical protein